MIKVRIKLKDKPGFTVPLPYFLLRTGGWGNFEILLEIG